jgi:small subunit ribosomal protein S20
LANHKSAEKRARQSERRRIRNRQVSSRVKTLVKQVHSSTRGGDVAEAREKLREAERGLRKAASKGVIPAKRASRRISRLARMIAKQSQGS